MTKRLIPVLAIFLHLGVATAAIAGPPEGRDRDRAAERSDREARDRHGREERDLREREARGAREARDAAKAAERDAADAAENLAENLADQLADASGFSGSNSGSGSSGDADDDAGGSTSGSSGSGDSVNSGSGSSNSGSGSSNSGSGSDDDTTSGSGYARIERDPNNQEFRERELVVLSEDGALANRAAALGFSIVESRQLGAIGSVVLRLRVPEGMTSAGALDLLRRAEPESPSGYNHLFRASGVAVLAMAAPPIFVAPAQGTVGVVDGFASDTVAGWSVNRVAASPARSGHGDVVAGILLEEMAGRYATTPKSLLLDDVVGAFGQAGASDVAALVVSLDHMSVAKADVVNISLTGPDNPVLARAVARTLEMGSAIVAAGGNGGPAAPPVFPAAYPGVIGVAAVDPSGRPWIYSAAGDQIDVAALGEAQTAQRGPAQFGTSFAAPRVTALIASRRSRSAAINPGTLLAMEARDAGAPGRDPVYGAGIIGLGAANGNDARHVAASRAVSAAAVH